MNLGSICAKLNIMKPGRRAFTFKNDPPVSRVPEQDEFCPSEALSQIANEEDLINIGISKSDIQKVAKKLTNNKNKLLQIKNLINAGVNLYFALTDGIKLSPENTDKIIKYVKSGFDYVTAREIINYDFDEEKVITELSPLKEYSVIICPFQTSKDAKITGTKFLRENDKIIRISKTITSDGEFISAVSEIPAPEITVGEDGSYLLNGNYTQAEQQDNKISPQLKINELSNWEINEKATDIPLSGQIKTRYKGSGITFEVEYSSFPNIQSVIEIINDKPSNSLEVIYSKQSPVLKGVYDTTKYDLSNYDENTDVISEIKKGTLKGGEAITNSGVNQDGSIFYDETYNHNGVKTERHYIQSEDTKIYSYRITDENGNSILDIARSFTKNEDGSTTTQVNDKTYTAVFDDENYTATITDETGKTTLLDLREKMKDNNNRTCVSKDFMEFIKEFPGDKLIKLADETEMIEEAKSGDSETEGRKIITEKNIYVTEHELGHIDDFKDDLYSMSGEISSNEELKEIYNEECKAFEREVPPLMSSALDYFGRAGGGMKSIGLAELTAETAALTSGVGCELPDMITRGQYLIKYFPKTIAKIALLAN